MKHHKFVITGIILILVTLVTTGCAAPKAEPCPTTLPVSCPTCAPQSCPTTAAQAMPEMDAYRTNTINTQANVIFTFDPGEKCSMQIKSKPTTSDFVYQIIVNDQAHLNYMLVGETLNSGYTIADVQEWVKNNPHLVEGPPMTTLKIYQAVNPMSNSIQLVQYIGEPLMFSCLTEGPDAHQVIADFDPLVMPTK